MKKIMLMLLLLLSPNALNCMEKEISHPMLKAIDDNELMLGRMGDNTGDFSYCLEHSMARPSHTVTITSYNFFLTALDATVPLDTTVQQKNPLVGPPNTLGSLYVFISQAGNNTDALWAQKDTIKAWLAEHREASLSSLSQEQQIHVERLETEQEEYAALFFYELQKKFAHK